MSIISAFFEGDSQARQFHFPGDKGKILFGGCEVVVSHLWWVTGQIDTTVGFLVGRNGSDSLSEAASRNHEACPLLSGRPSDGRPTFRIQFY